MADPRPAPYPADTRAKGWRFELDIERVMQSDTWALATPDARPWLLMLWITAWQQVPCGSMPSDDLLIAARLGMQPKAFAKVRAVLLRGWWLADDGRLYHDVIAERVREMLERKDSERKRKAEYRARMDAERKAAESRTVPGLSHGTDAGLPGDSGGSDATGTGTGTGLRDKESADVLRPAQARAGIACRRMRTAGLPDTNPAHPTLLALIAAGITDDELAAAAEAAVAKGKGFAYALAVAEGRRRDAAAVQPLPDAPPSPEEQARAAAESEAARTAAYLAEQEAQRAASRSPEAQEARRALLARVRGGLSVIPNETPRTA